MRKHIACAGAIALGALFSAPAHGEGFPASKHAVAYGGPAVVSEGSWQPILAQKIKTANAKGLGIHVSLECGLYTSNLVRSKGLTKADAKASVKVRVLVDGVEAADPGEVTFCSRGQKTSAAFAGIFEKLEGDGASCFVIEDVDTDGDGVTDAQLVKIEPDCLRPEELELIEDSMSAHSFYFYYDDTAPGVHMVTVEAFIDEETGLENPDTAGDQGAKATIGNGSMLIEEIRLIHGANGDTLEL